MKVNNHRTRKVDEGYLIDEGMYYQEQTVPAISEFIRKLKGIPPSKHEEELYNPEDQKDVRLGFTSDSKHIEVEYEGKRQIFSLNEIFSEELIYRDFLIRFLLQWLNQMMHRDEKTLIKDPTHIPPRLEWYDTENGLKQEWEPSKL